MSNKLKGRKVAGSRYTQRLVALVGLVAIVGAVIAVLFALDVIGGVSGIRKVSLAEPPRLLGQESLAVGPGVGELAPDFELSDFQDDRYSLSEFRGKAVYVNFWATWCTPCLVELPDIQTLQTNHADELVVITVNRQEPVERARNFFASLPLRDGGAGVTFAVNGMDPNDTLYRELVGFGMPASLFIDASGVISSTYNSIIPLSTMEDAVAQALASAPITRGS